MSPRRWASVSRQHRRRWRCWVQAGKPRRGSRDRWIRVLERTALDRSIKHNFYRASVVSEADILAQAMRLGYGSGLTPGRPEGSDEENIRSSYLGKIKGRPLVTTHTVLAEERQNIAWVKEGMGTLPALIPNYQIRDKDPQRGAAGGGAARTEFPGSRDGHRRQVRHGKDLAYAGSGAGDGRSACAAAGDGALDAGGTGDVEEQRLCQCPDGGAVAGEQEVPG